MTDIEGYKWLEAKLEEAKNGNFGRSKLFELLKRKLSELGYWKNKPRGNPRKGYERMKNVD